MNIKVGIVGGGSWGTAAALLLNSNGNDVKVWEYDSQVIKTVNKYHINKVYLPKIKIPAAVKFYPDMTRIIEWCDLIVFALPSEYYRKYLKKIVPFYKGQIFVNLTKGIELKSSKRCSEIFLEIFGEKIFRTQSMTEHIKILFKGVKKNVSSGYEIDKTGFIYSLVSMILKVFNLLIVFIIIRKIFYFFWT